MSYIDAKEACVNTSYAMVSTKNINKTAEFFYKALDLRPGYRSDYSYPGMCLYSDDKLLIHLVAKVKLRQKVQAEYIASDDSAGRGPVNYVAIEGGDYTQLITRLNKYNINYSERTVALLRQHQVLIYGPYLLKVQMIFAENKSSLVNAPNVLLDESK